MHRLEKLNSSIDIIPLQQSMDASNNKRLLGPGVSGVVGLSCASKTIDRPRPSGDGPVRDPVLISRVKQYLYAHENEVYVCVDRMSDELQTTYRDYRNKKRTPFRAMVRRAYDEITENLTRQVDSNWQDDDDDDINIEVDSMPSEYMQAYKRQAEMTSRQNGNTSDKELIDISSDDDQPKIAPTFKFPDRDPMDLDMQVAKRPHLSPSYERSQQMSAQSQQMGPVLQSRINRSEKSRKRPRDKEHDIQFESMRKKYKDISITQSNLNFSSVGGTEKILETIVNLLLHLKHPEVYKNLGVPPPRGFLLHGPPGCGKTLLAHAISGELKVPLLKVAAPELVSGVSGESEQRIRDLFDQAIAIAPCIVFLDEIDAIISDRATAQRGMEKRIVSQLILCLDELNMKEKGNRVLVLGATNRPESLDPALRRAGRFDREVSLGIPDKEARLAILQIHTSKVRLSPEINLQNIAALTPGFVGADLVALVREAVMVAVNRALQDMKKNVPTIAEHNNEVANDVLVEEEVKKPAELDITDVIIEDDDTIVKVDAVKTTEEKEKTEDEPATSTTEEPKKLEETAEPQSSTDSTPSSEQTLSVSTDVVKPVKEVADTPGETLKPSSTDELAPSENKSVVDAPTAAAVTPAVAATSASAEPAQNMIEVLEEITQTEEPVSKLTDLLGWLHDDPPLTSEQLALICVEERDFDAALKTVQPSAKREGFATVPDVTWNDIGSLQDIRQELQMTILAPVRYSEQFANLGLTTPSGVLLCGPPGCGKTLLAKAIANEAGINFISVKGPELLNMYVGESEKAVRQCFIRARNSAPCVIFFDELDALCPKRSENDNSVTSRVVNQMLTEMDGIEGRKNVYLMAASNRPDIIDPAVLRPGRLDKILYVGLPSPTDRADILRAVTKNGTKPKLSREVDLEIVANDNRCNGFTGADLAALVKEAGNEVLREIISDLPTTPEICSRHIYAAFDRIQPSVQKKDLQRYESLRKLYSVKKNHNTDVQMSLDVPVDSVEAMET
ncbi:nuclear valosin-containing protein-like [Copidosoma floridanum]|uniref:nuclear valosin-containing protein-like n=1 Tax=Copidosoma floridanum TaxID=29053 RepID=UPI0006C9A88C|nr:nuclear valosin-containing protein-like [Copidosoma floridanum]